MKIRVVAALLLSAMAAVPGTVRAGESHEPQFRVRIETSDPVALRAQLERAGYDVVEAPPDSPVEVVVSRAELQRLKRRGLNAVVIEEGRPLQEVLQQQAALQPQVLAAVPANYRDLNGIINRMREIASANPSIAQVVDVTATYGTPTTFQGRHLFALKISDNVAVDEDEPAVLIVSTHHAREIVAPVIALNAAERLIAGYGSDPRITSAVNGHVIWVAPVWNPDGYDYVFTVDNLWRKNRRIFSNGVGVDQNRNYPQGWNSTLCSGSTLVSSDTYKGPSPASEAETQTMMTWSQNERFAKVIDYHSTGREVLYSYHCLSHPFTSWMLQEATAISQASGYGGATRLPSAEGEHQEWEFAQMGAYAFLIETHTQFQPPYDSALAEAAMVWPGILSVIERPISISGHVTDAVTGAALEARIELLNVTFPNGETNSSGGRYGRYHMFLPPGTYDVRFSKAGYVSVVRTVSVTSSSASVMDIRLAPPDTTPPDTTLTATPPAVTNSASASFTFAATEAGSTFQCALDGGGFAPCASPQTYSALASGNHTFQVRATDPAGNTDPTPASFTWTVDTVAPDTIITATPPAVTNSASASFTFAATEAGSTFQCALDGGGFAPCASPQTYSALASGNHTFQVRATDPAGNTDPTPASFTWTVDTVAPDTIITATPPALANSASASFTFAATEAGSTFQCALDGSGFAPCASPQTYSALASGNHTFQVRATDPAGNTDPTPASFTWTVDTSPPVRSGGQPMGTLPAGTTQTTLALTTIAAATCRYSPSAGVPYDAMTQTFATTGGTAHSTPVSGLADGGSYAFYVRCLDTAANANPDDFAISFTVDFPADTAPPVRSGGQPMGTLPAGTTQTTLALTTNEAATCRYSPSAGVPYDAMTQTFATTGGTAHSAPVSGLVDGGSYAFYVRCLDTVANANPDDFAISFTVDLPADTAPPVRSGGQPLGTLPAGTTQTTLALTTNEAATCRYSPSAGVPYDAMTQTFATTGGTAHSTPVSGLVDGSSYAFYVRCLDTAANANPDDFAISFTVDNTPTVDTTPPARSGAQPTGTLPAGTTQTTLALTTNEAATCRYSPSAGVPYDAMTQTF